jgi:hypothetical protein
MFLRGVLRSFQATYAGRQLTPTDIPPTLAIYLSVKPSSGSVEIVLTKVLP